MSASVISGAGIETRDPMLDVARRPEDRSLAKAAIVKAGKPGVLFSVWMARTTDDGSHLCIDLMPITLMHHKSFVWAIILLRVLVQMRTAVYGLEEGLIS